MKKFHGFRTITLPRGEQSDHDPRAGIIRVLNTPSVWENLNALTLGANGDPEIRIVVPDNGEGEEIEFGRLHEAARTAWIG